MSATPNKTRVHLQIDNRVGIPSREVKGDHKTIKQPNVTSNFTNYIYSKIKRYIPELWERVIDESDPIDASIPGTKS